jgi:GNAT superfamily N-acetyltransferase
MVALMALLASSTALLCSVHGTNLRCHTALNIETSLERAQRRQQRWESATRTLEASVEQRRRKDHRARLARLVGIYVGETPQGTLRSDAEVLIAMQPDQGGRKLLFLSPVDGLVLGFIELETLSAGSSRGLHAVGCEEVAHAVPGEGVPTMSVLRGMRVAEDSRGKGYARLFLAMWLSLCEQAGVTPATSRINKPLLALTLVRLGFTPLRGRGKQGLRGKLGKSRKAHQRPLAVEVSVGREGQVILHCSTPAAMKRLRAGFCTTELTSQRLLLAEEPPLPRGRVAHIRVRYAPPAHRAAMQERIRGHAQPASIVHTPLVEAAIGGRLRLSALEGPTSGPPTTIAKAEVLRVLTGRLEEDATQGIEREIPQEVTTSRVLEHAREKRRPTSTGSAASRSGSVHSQVLVACQETRLRPRAIMAVAAMRAAGVGVTLAPEEKTFKWAFKHANRIGVDHVVLFARCEAQDGLARVKRMQDGEQADVEIDQLGSWFKPLDMP